MSNELNLRTEPRQPTVYHIRIQGHLSDQWARWFEGFAITLDDNGDTRLTGPVVDQAALYGLLRKVRDLGLPLISVTRVEYGQGDGSDTKQHGAPSYSEREEQDELN